ncbi:MAG: LamG-like jellyroll fold domain-containing protein [Taibaiella sp.]|jgi:hypothetical protein
MKNHTKYFFKCSKYLLPCILLFAIGSLSTFGQGAGKAALFSDNISNDHFNLGTALSDSLATTNFTIEFWAKFNNPTSDPALISNKNWSSGGNIGFNLCWRASGPNKLRFNFKPAGGTRRDFDIPIASPERWNHIAILVDRSGLITAFVDGIAVGTPVDISGDVGKTLVSALPVRLGQDGAGAYPDRIKCELDEVRFWKDIRSENEIREYMCRKLNGNESDLLAYYRFDEPDGSVANNLTLSTAGLFTGTLSGNPERVFSAAAIGDTSSLFYSNSFINFSGQVVTLGSMANGILKLSNMGNSMKGIHVYRINGILNSASGIPNLGNDSVCFGIFPVSDTTEYNMTYDYATFPGAVTYYSGIDLYRRETADSQWSVWGAIKDINGNEFLINNKTGRNEVIVGNFVHNITCDTPSALGVQNLDRHNADVTWVSGGGNRWHLSYGTGLFNPDMAGTLVQNLNTTSYHLSGLALNTLYSFYVQEVCPNDTTQVSFWKGPYTFRTLACEKVDSVQVTDITDHAAKATWAGDATTWNIEYGVAGFGIGTGILASRINEHQRILTGLTPGTAYAFYIQDSCSVGLNPWQGPYTFSTTGGASSVTAVSKPDVIKLYPNPAHNQVTISWEQELPITRILLKNIVGQVLMTKDVAGNSTQLNTADFSDGVYFAELIMSGKQSIIKKLIIKR